MASFHTIDTPCAQCLHGVDDPGDGPIPTTALVSFWAGLVAAAYALRINDDVNGMIAQQQIYFMPFRPDFVYRAPVMRREGCPTCSARNESR
jgi:hypothetical protein